MVKFKLDFVAEKTKIELVDDAEGTPGTSRQYTRFKKLIPEFERAWNNTRSYDFELATKTLMNVLTEEKFKVIAIKRDGHNAIFTAETIEQN